MTQRPLTTGWVSLPPSVMCQCEHPAHFGKSDHHTCYHGYGEVRAVARLHDFKRGEYTLCSDCMSADRHGHYMGKVTP